MVQYGVFSNPAQYTIGNAGRGLITGPDLFDTDLNLEKHFALPWREGMQLEFRAEFCNAAQRTIGAEALFLIGARRIGGPVSAMIEKVGNRFVLLVINFRHFFRLL